MSRDTVRLVIEQLMLPPGIVDSARFAAELERELAALLDESRPEQNRVVDHVRIGAGDGTTSAVQLARRLAAVLRNA